MLQVVLANDLTPFRHLLEEELPEHRRTVELKIDQQAIRQLGPDLRLADDSGQLGDEAINDAGRRVRRRIKPQNDGALKPGKPLSLTVGTLARAGSRSSPV